MPRPIFSEIIMKVGTESLEDIINCRQVCKNWNQMILDLTKRQIDTIRRSAAERLNNSLWDASNEDIAMGMSLGKTWKN